MSANTTGNNNHAFGQGALRANTTGGQNVAIGRLALAASNADSNTAVGHNALTSDTSGANNTAIGSSALAFNTTASNNTAVGYQAAYGNTTGLNTTIGSQALYSGSTASRNTVVGFQAGYSTTGSYNTFIGDGSGYSVTSGSKNTIIGNYSGNQGGLNITTASNYIVLSDGDGNPRAYCDNDYTTVINAPSGKTYSQFDWRIGNVAKASIWWNDSTTRLQTYTTVHGPYLTQGGTSWTNSSDERLKNITGEIQDGLNKVCSLRAAEYTWKSDETAKPQVGLIAQDVLAVLPQAVDVPIEGAVEKDGGEAMLGVNYDHVIPLLVAAIKELKADLDATKAELAALKGSQ
jgi:hypothetical protein